MELTREQEKEQPITNKEIYSNLYHLGGIYGYMYGKRIQSRPIEEDIIFIEKKYLKIGKYADCFIFTWGWPGPDANIYEFKDYSKTWSFYKKDLMREEGVVIDPNS